jgi:hypothetical protein
MSFTPLATNSVVATVTSVNAGAGAIGSIASSTKTIDVGAISPTNDVVVKVTCDRYGSETTWQIKNTAGTVVASGGPFTDGAANGSFPQPDVYVSLPNGCYDLVVNDAYGDGFDSGYGNGKIEVVSAATVVSDVSDYSTGSSVLDAFQTNAIIDPVNYSITASDSAICSGTSVHLSVNLFGTYRAGTVFCNGTPTSVVDVINATTGKVWMDRNLGASQVATSETDSSAYGDLYQWGRRSDGHQCRTSGTTTSLSSTDQPSNGNFILAAPLDWLSPQNDNLWQGVNGVNNPCPFGYRLPTESELDAEFASWISTNLNGAFVSPLKLSAAGFRDGDGSLGGAGVNGLYWGSTVFGAGSRRLNSYSSGANLNASSRANGFSVRCIKDVP